VELIYTSEPSQPVPDPNGKSVLIDQAMEMLGVSKRTVYYRIRQGRLQTIRTRGGSQRVLLASIHDLVRSQAPAPRPAPSEALSGFTS
jgi:excisionase family DNA binding protein